MNSRAPIAPLGVSGLSATAYLINRTVQGLLIAAISGGLFWLVWIYASGLRDPRYFDGWVLAGAMVMQITFHIAKLVGLSPKAATRWRKFHIFAGYLVIAAFVSHADFSMPDTSFEWWLWVGFVVVVLSGIFGTYLTWSLQSKRRIEEGVSYDGIPALRAELERAFQVVVAETNPPTAAIDLPGLPYDDWIKELCTTELADFFKGPRNFPFHLIGSRRPVKRLTGTIDGLSHYVDQESREKLGTIRKLVIEKDRLDFTLVTLALTKGWLFVHVPVTYGLIILSIVHILVVYSFSSGVW